MLIRFASTVKETPMICFTHGDYTIGQTTGVFGPVTMEFLRELGRRLQLVSVDHNSFTNLIQRLSVAVQRGNVASVLGSARRLESQDFFDCIVIVYKFHYYNQKKRKTVATSIKIRSYWTPSTSGEWVGSRPIHKETA